MAKSLPMILTLLRLAAGPIVAGLVLWAAQLAYVDPPRAGQIYGWACGLFVVASLSDWLDGYLARKLNVASPLGAALDHGADKVLTACVLMALAYAALPLDLTIAALLLVGRDALMAALREGLPNTGALKVGALGKVKAAAAMAAIAALLAQPAASLLGAGADVAVRLGWAGSGLLWAATALALISTADYVWSARKASRTSSKSDLQP